MKAYRVLLIVVFVAVCWSIYPAKAQTYQPEDCPRNIAFVMNVFASDLQITTTSVAVFFTTPWIYSSFNREQNKIQGGPYGGYYTDYVFFEDRRDQYFFSTSHYDRIQVVDTEIVTANRFFLNNYEIGIAYTVSEGSEFPCKYWISSVNAPDGGTLTEYGIGTPEVFSYGSYGISIWLYNPMSNEVKFISMWKP